MGPAYLLDVVGIDTGHHAGDVMAQGFPARMSKEGRTAIDVMYKPTASVRRTARVSTPTSRTRRASRRRWPTPLLRAAGPIAKPKQDFDKGRHHRPHDDPDDQRGGALPGRGIVATPAEADIALVYGLELPSFRGGVFRYLDTIGLDRYVAVADQYADLGPLYRVSDRLRRDGRPGQNLLLIAEGDPFMKDVVIVDRIRTPMGRSRRRLPQRACRRLVRAPDEIHPAAQPQPRPERIGDICWAACSRPRNRASTLPATPPCWPAFPKQVGRSPSTACAAPPCRRCTTPPAPSR